MIFADKRYRRKEFLDKMPLWIRQQMETAHQDLSTDVAVLLASSFYKDMGQTFTMPKELMLTASGIEQIETKLKI